MSWLGAGAGAAQGLEQSLARQREDELIGMQKASAAETKRAHIAEEGLHGQDLYQKNEQRNEDRQARLDDQKTREGDRQTARTLSTIKMRPMGSNVTLDEHVRELGAGAPSSIYEESDGPELPAGSEGPRLPVFKFRGIADQQEQAAKNKVAADNISADNARADLAHADAVEQRKSTDAATAEQRKFTNNVATQGLAIRQQQLKDAEAKRKEGEGEVKLGAKAKDTMSSLDRAEPMIDRVLASFPKDIEDPNAPPDQMGVRTNQKYNTIGDKLGNFAKVLKYKAGFKDEDSPITQIEYLLQPTQGSQFMAGSRNYKMMELALQHLSDPGLTDSERYSRLKTLKAMIPEMRQGVVNSERPVKVDPQGRMMDTSGGPRAGAPTGAATGPLKVGRFTIEPE